MVSTATGHEGDTSLVFCLMMTLIGLLLDAEGYLVHIRVPSVKPSSEVTGVLDSAAVSVAAPMMLDCRTLFIDVPNLQREVI